MNEASRRGFPSACIRILPVTILLCGFIFGCSDSTEPEPRSPARTVSSDIGPGGGALSLTAPDGTVCDLAIPAGALSGTSKIRITAELFSSGSHLGPLSKDFLLEPEGLEFDAPVTITLTVADTLAADRAPAILHTASGGPGILLETQANGLIFEANLDHFSHACPVAPTEQELELYWGTILLEIDSFGVSVDLVRSLVGIYLHAQAHTAAYGSIDLDAWKIELWAHTNDLVIKGSLRCSGGDGVEGRSILNAALNIASIMFFTDLEAAAQQALADCNTGGTIVIDQNPDGLTGAGWSLTGPHSRTGSGDITLTDMPPGDYTVSWVAVAGYLQPPGGTKTLAAGEAISFLGAYVPDSGGDIHEVLMRISDANGIAEIIWNDLVAARAYWGTDPDGGNNGIYPGDTGWRGGSGVYVGSHTVRLVVRPNPDRTAYPQGNFEIMVDGVLIIDRRLEIMDPNGTVEETVTLSF